MEAAMKYMVVKIEGSRREVVNSGLTLAEAQQFAEECNVFVDSIAEDFNEKPAEVHYEVAAEK
jgi:hypothetical protein